MPATIWEATAPASVPVVDLISLRNRIINGDMRVDQRNAGAAVTVNSAVYTYAVDRWAGFGQAADGVFTLQQLSATPPEGFTNYLRATVTTADAAIGAAQNYLLAHKIEGYNVADFDFGKSTAKSTVLSIRVRSSLAGTFSGSLLNNGADRAYVFTFTINAPNVWEYKTIVLPGDVTGTWTVDNTTGVFIFISLGVGSNFKGASAVWGNTLLYAATGSVDLIGTNGATLDIAAAQFESGTVATEFERRFFSDELDRCQRYYEKAAYEIWSGNVTSGNNNYIWTRFRTLKRIAPVIVGVDLGVASFPAGVPSFVGIPSTTDGFRAEKTANATASGFFAFSWTASAEL